MISKLLGDQRFLSAHHREWMIKKGSKTDLILGLLFGSQGARPHPEPLGVGFHLEAQQPQAAYSNHRHTRYYDLVRLLSTVHPLQ